jgi:hypothetical protein
MSENNKSKLAWAEKHERALDWIANTNGIFIGSYLAYHTGLMRSETAKLLRELISEGEIEPLNALGTCPQNKPQALKQPLKRTYRMIGQLGHEERTSSGYSSLLTSPSIQEAVPPARYEREMKPPFKQQLTQQSAVAPSIPGVDISALVATQQKQPPPPPLPEAQARYIKLAKNR